MTNRWSGGLFACAQQPAPANPAPPNPAPANPAPAPQKPTATVTSDVDVYESVGDDGGVNKLGILRSGKKVQLLGSCNKQDWCHVSGDGVPGGSGWVWGALDF